MRRSHTIRYNTGVTCPSRLVVLDCETYPVAQSDGSVENRLLLAGVKALRVRSWNPYQVSERLIGPLYTIDEVWDAVESYLYPRTRLLVFAHNWAFDLPVLGGFERLAGRGWEIKSTVLDSPPFLAELRRGDKTMLLIDTLNYFPFSLAALGRELGLPKLTMPAQGSPTHEVWEYCARDVEILARVVIEWFRTIKEDEWGSWGITIAQQAWNLYRHRHYHTPIHVHDDAEVLRWERQAYMGGRTECFKIGKISGPLYDLDVNSLYPSVMSSGEFPVKLLSKGVGVDGYREAMNYPERIVLAHVLVSTTIPAYPKRSASGLIFPVGRYWTWLCGPELRWAHEHGNIVDVQEWATYQSAPIFRDYVNYLYPLRLKYKERGETYRAFLCKLLLNSLYGKFGQRGYRWDVTRKAHADDPPQWSERDLVTGEVMRYRRVADVVQCLTRDDEWRHSCPIIAACVTSYGRMRLWGYMMHAGLDNVYYCDTDSLLVNDDGYNRLARYIDPSRLGALRLVKQVGEATIYTPKDYILDGTVKRKGIRPNAEEIAPGVYRQEQFVGMLGMIREGDTSRQRIRRVIKRLRRVYLKGRVQDDGRVDPFILDET